jgi:hypothetical protein
MLVVGSWAPLLFVWSFFTFWVFVCLHIVEGVAYVYNGVWVNGNEGMYAIAWTAYIGFVAAVAGPPPTPPSDRPCKAPSEAGARPPSVPGWRPEPLRMGEGLESDATPSRAH